MEWSTSWHNRGVAPVYNQYDVAVQLVSKSNPANKLIVATDIDIKKMLPGNTDVKAAIRLPGHLEAGDYDIELGVVTPGTKKPAIKLAIEGKSAEGWYKMGTIKIVS